MVIYCTTDGVTIRNCIGDTESVRVSSGGEISFWLSDPPAPFESDGPARRRKAKKPFCELELNECADLLKELGVLVNLTAIEMLYVARKGR